MIAASARKGDSAHNRALRWLRKHGYLDDLRTEERSNEPPAAQHLPLLFVESPQPCLARRHVPRQVRRAPFDGADDPPLSAHGALNEYGIRDERVEELAGLVRAHLGK